MELFGIGLIGLAASAALVASLRSWRFGLFGLLIFLPFAGIISLRSGQNTFFLLAKDIVFVFPSYISFFILQRVSIVQTRVRGVMIAGMVGLAFLVLAQSLNPNLPNLVVPLLGIKVWLMYMPLAFIAAASFDTRNELLKLLRVIVGIAIVPLSVGLLQRVGLDFLGREATASVFYGDDFDLERFGVLYAVGDYGSGAIYRLNSTFASNGNYFLYTVTVITMALVLASMERSRKWRLFAHFILVLSVFASFMSGSRSAGLFVPILLAPFLLLGASRTVMVAGIILLPIGYVISLSVMGLEVLPFISFLADYGAYNAQEFGWLRFVDAISDNPLGRGTGMNTGAARYAFPSEEEAFAALSGVENFYVKTIVELSVLGLIPVALISLAPIVQSLSLARGARNRDVGKAAAAMCGFFLLVAIQNLRAWPMDIDPVNVMFWVTVGMLYKLQYLDAAARPGQAAVGPTANLSSAPIGSIGVA